MTNARLWHPWLRINRVLRVMLQTRWSAEAWLAVRVEFRRALALRSEIRRADWFTWDRDSSERKHLDPRLQSEALTRPSSATGTAWERTPWLATQRAAWEALKKKTE